MPAKFIYEPWKAPIADQKKAGCIIGVDYPKPIVDHDVVSKENMGKMAKAYEAHKAGEAGGKGGDADGDGASSSAKGKRPLVQQKLSPAKQKKSVVKEE